ncbi:MAG: ABC transporter ATP-binding protein [Proteobacteria bacterium]|nr:ABC transporter ATP-binding protein [Pseudomonadota bacterium]
MAAVIETRDLAVAFGEGDSRLTVFHHLNVSVEEGEFVTLVGVSGSGKSTLLRVIADLIPSLEGGIDINTARVPSRRPIAMVFQAANLMPWRTISDNIALGLEGLEVTDSVREERVNGTLDLIGLADCRDRWPYQLSGGQRQRIGIARALAVEPDILLMDEPFGALDAITRAVLQDELLRIWKETRKSVLFVTHDIEEAVYLGDRVLLLGGKPAEIIREYPITMDRAKRRGGEGFLRQVEEIKAGLMEAMTNGEVLNHP